MFNLLNLKAIITIIHSYLYSCYKIYNPNHFEVYIKFKS